MNIWKYLEEYFQKYSFLEHILLKLPLFEKKRGKSGMAFTGAIGTLFIIVFISVTPHAGALKQLGTQCLKFREGYVPKAGGCIQK